MSRLLAVLILSASVALAAPAISLPAGYKVQKSVVSGTRQIVLAWKNRVTAKSNTPDTTLILARDHRSGKTLWSRILQGNLKLDPDHAIGQGISLGRTDKAQSVHYLLSEANGEIYASNINIKP
jgi:hypothetical protein